MRKSTTALTPAQVYRFAVDFCQPHLDLKPAGKVTATILLTVLFAASGTELFDLRDLPSPGRRPLRGDLRQGPLRQPLLCRAAQAQNQCRLPTACPGLCTPPQATAPRRHRSDPSASMASIPWTAARSTGPRPRPALTRSSLATAYVMRHGQRFTLAVTAVTRSELLKDVLQELLALVSKAGLKPSLLLLDRGFYSVAIIRYLQQARRPFLMPVICHGRKADHPKGPSGSNRFKLMKKSGWFTHTLQDAKKKKATVSICVNRTRLTNRHGRKKWDTWVYAYWGITPSVPTGSRRPTASDSGSRPATGR